jgi:UPF0755 protein
MIILGSGGYWLYNYRLMAPMPFYDNLYYTVEPNTTLSEIAMDLMDKDLLDYPTALTWVMLARFQKRAHLIKAGEYLIQVGTTPQQFLDILIGGKAFQHGLTIPEGWNFRQLIAAIHNHPQLVHTLHPTDDNTIIMERLGKAKQHPEGRFYPSTYFFPMGTTDVAFLQRAYNVMERELKDAWNKRAKELPLQNADEALILASIIEKESSATSERHLIAGVFIRRLKKKMLLQSDPTVIYALGENYNGDIRKDDLRNDSPYNTYIHKGLPPTPIAMPGRASLQAAVNPTEGETLFFVAKGNGSHYFSVTYREHECAVIEYQLKNKSPSRFQSRCKQYPTCNACRPS